MVLFSIHTHTLTHTFRHPRSSKRPRFDHVQKAVASDKGFTWASHTRTSRTTRDVPQALTSSDGAAAALNLNGGARRKPPLSQLGPAALAGHNEIRQLRLQSMQIAVLFVWSCAASHSPLLHHHKQMKMREMCACAMRIARTSSRACSHSISAKRASFILRDATYA
jgi:hypothetical protein